MILTMGLVSWLRMTLGDLTESIDTHLSSAHTTKRPILSQLGKCPSDGGQDCCKVIWGRFSGGEEIANQLFKGRLLIWQRRGRALQVVGKGVVCRQEEVES